MRNRRARRRSRRPPLASIGAVLILVAGALTYVSYNALSGLPLQSRYHVYVTLPSADRLVATDDVRIADVRVGEVSSVTAELSPQGRPYARIGLALEPSVGQLPVDTTAQARSVSPLGETYLALVLGGSRTRIPSGGRLAASRARTSVSVTDLFRIFDGNARQSFQQATGQLAAGLAGRGAGINDAIASTASLLEPATRVAGALAMPRAGIRPFLSGLATTAETLAPVGHDLAGTVSRAAITLNALDRRPAALGGTLDAVPVAERATTRALAAVAPGLDDLATLMTDLQPGARLLPRGVRTINTTLSAGAHGLGSTNLLLPPLRRAFSALATVARRPSSSGAVRKFGDLLDPVQTLVQTAGVAQEHCNIFGLLLISLSSVFNNYQVRNGPPVLFFPLDTLGVPGENVQSAKPTPGVHVNNSPVENASECESNNEPFNAKQTLLRNPAGLQSDHTRQTSPPPGVLERARAAGLLAQPPGTSS